MSRKVEEAKQKTKIVELLENLLTVEITSDNSCSNICDLILSLYSENTRLSYFVISEYIIDKYQDDETMPDILVDQLSSFSDYLTASTIISDEEDYEKIHRYTLKISDHIKLEKLRQENLRQNHKQQVVRFINRQTTKIQESHDVLNSKIDKIDVSAVTILGVFTAITISVFGTLNIFSSLLFNLYMLSIPRALFSFAFSGFIIFNTIFLLLHTISKFTNTSLEKQRARDPNSSKPELTGSRFRFVRDFKNFRNMYPLVFYYNVSMGITMVSSIALWALNRQLSFF